MKPTVIQIREAGMADLEVVQSLGKQTFLETFSASNTPEDMQAYLDKSFTSEKVGNELSNPESAFYLAVWEERPVGYLKINSGNAQTEMKDENALEIERIYVLDEFQGKKIGHLLFGKALDLAKKQGARYLWLGVWEKNLKAIQFYQKNGFYVFDQHLFKLGEDIQTDLMMRIDL